MRLGTRAALGLLWLRRSWRFRWAHKPLCERFRRDVLSVGGVYLCRSCVFLYAGVILAALALSVAEIVEMVPATAPRGTLVAGLFAALGSTLLLSAPPVYKRLPRAARDVLRFAAGALLPASVYVLVNADALAGGAALALLCVFWLVYFRLRRRRKLRECDGCEELGAAGEEPGVCSGYALQAEAARRYEREASERVMRSGYAPGGRERGSDEGPGDTLPASQGGPARDGPPGGSRPPAAPSRNVSPEGRRTGTPKPGAAVRGEGEAGREGRDRERHGRA